MTETFKLPRGGHKNVVWVQKQGQAKKARQKHEVGVKGWLL